MATWCEELTHWKRPWCWERLRAWGEGDDRGWDGWMASPTQWTWVWVDSGVGDGQGSLACCDSCGHIESDTTEWLNWTEPTCFFYELTDVVNLISGSSAFYKCNLNIWKFSVHVLLKPGLENFERYFASIWDECNCAVVWTFFGIGMKTDLFQSCGHCWVFQICWHIECSTFTALPFKIWSSSTGILSHTLTL